MYKYTFFSEKPPKPEPPKPFFSNRDDFFSPKIGGNKKYVYICSPKTKVSGRHKRRDAGVVDRAALEMRCTGNCTGGSNPSLSATNAENQQIAKQTPSFTPKNVKSGVFVLFKIIQPLHNKRVAILKESDEKRLIFIYPFSLIFQDFTSSWKYLLLYSNVRSGL